jgi:hypothetical protein
MYLAYTERFMTSSVRTPHGRIICGYPWYRKRRMPRRLSRDITRFPFVPLQFPTSAARICAARPDLTNYIRSPRITCISVRPVHFPLRHSSYHGDFTSTARPTTGRPLRIPQDTHNHLDNLQLYFCDSPTWCKLQEPQLLSIDRPFVMDWTCKYAPKV